MNSNIQWSVALSVLMVSCAPTSEGHFQVWLNGNEENFDRTNCYAVQDDGLRLNFGAVNWGPPNVTDSSVGYQLEFLLDRALIKPGTFDVAAQHSSVDREEFFEMDVGHNPAVKSVGLEFSAFIQSADFRYTTQGSLQVLNLTDTSFAGIVILENRGTIPHRPGEGVYEVVADFDLPTPAP